ncbi:MAG: substrate-binding domain-containing protein, partial [bacterium]
MIKKTLAMGAVALGLAYHSAASARDYITIVGSSTVYPFTTVVAEQFGKTGGFKTPKIESTGTGGGVKLFCAGVGVDHADIVNASRRIKDSEVKACEQNGVTDILEVKIGYDGIAIANSKASPQYNLSLKDVYLALAKEIPDPKGGQTVLPNPYKTWKEVNPELLDKKIEVLGPPPTSGTRDAFAELAMEGGCKQFDWIKALKDQEESKYKALCHT